MCCTPSAPTTSGTTPMKEKIEMPKMRFSDGMEFDTTGPARVESRSDGLYVVGRGLLVPVSTQEEGDALVERIELRLK